MTSVVKTTIVLYTKKFLKMGHSAFLTTYLFYIYQNSFFRLRHRFLSFLMFLVSAELLDMGKAMFSTYINCNTVSSTLWLCSFLIWLLCKKKKGIVARSSIMSICFTNDSCIRYFSLCFRTRGFSSSCKTNNAHVLTQTATVPRTVTVFAHM